MNGENLNKSFEEILRQNCEHYQRMVKTYSENINRVFLKHSFHPYITQDELLELGAVRYEEYVDDIKDDINKSKRGILNGLKKQWEEYNHASTKLQTKMMNILRDNFGADFEWRNHLRFDLADRFPLRERYETIYDSKKHELEKIAFATLSYPEIYVDVLVDLYNKIKESGDEE